MDDHRAQCGRDPHDQSQIRHIRAHHVAHGKPAVAAESRLHAHHKFRAARPERYYRQSHNKWCQSKTQRQRRRAAHQAFCPHQEKHNPDTHLGETLEHIHSREQDNRVRGEAAESTSQTKRRLKMC